MLAGVTLSAKKAMAGEVALIERIRARAQARTRGALRLGIGDDCAVLAVPSGHELLVTTDFTLERRHFRREWHSPQSVGHRCLARGLSDLAAMGAKPLAAFLSLALPRELTGAKNKWLEGFLDGLLALAAQHGVPLAGGDTAESPSKNVLADIVLLGSAPKGRSLRRAGARAEDDIYVTGALGGAAAELELVQKTPKRFANARADGGHPHLFPQTRLAVGQALLRRGLATACIDISDGLSTDLAHLCSESGVGAEIAEAALPVHTGATLQQALHGGEDYELLFTARAGTKMPKKIAGVAITRIGRIVKKREMTLIAANGKKQPLEAKGWEHFSG